MNNEDMHRLLCGRAIYRTSSGNKFRVTLLRPDMQWRMAIRPVGDGEKWTREIAFSSRPSMDEVERALRKILEDKK